MINTISAANKAKMDRLSQLKAQWLQNLEPLSSNDELKKFRFACQRGVNTPVNAINAVSAAHLKDKLDKLRCLLNGQPVEVGDVPLSTSAHPLGIPFCKNLLARKMVGQGADVVSSKPEYAFSMGFSVVVLWQEFPDFGDLFLAHLYEACPYLVPRRVNLEDYPSQEEGYRAQGYKYGADGTIEEQPKFVKRMSGLARLYAAICTSTLPSACLDASAPHPHGLGHLWSWLASQLNLRPVNDVTATLVHDVLEVGGAALLGFLEGL